MANPPLPPSHDLVRLIRETLDETTAALLEHFRRRPNKWGYQKARILAPYALCGDVPLAALKHACDSAKMLPAGRAANWEVVEAVHRVGSGRILQCHGMDHGTLRIRKDLALRVASDFYFVEGGVAKVFWLQPRRGFALTDKQLGMFGALIRAALLKGDFEEAGIEILDLSTPPRRPRVVRRLCLDDLPAIGEEELVEGLQRVVDAYDAIMRMEIDWKALRSSGKTASGDSSHEGDLFPD